jgi:hypothetical protein
MLNFKLITESGQDIWYWLPDQDVRELKPGQEEPLQIESKVMGRMRSVDEAVRGQTISIQINGEFKPVSNIPIDKIASYVLLMNPEDKSMMIIMDVSIICC